MDYSFVLSFIISCQNIWGNALFSGGRGGTESLWTQQVQSNAEERLGLKNMCLSTTAFTLHRKCVIVIDAGRVPVSIWIKVSIKPIF